MILSALEHTVSVRSSRNRMITLEILTTAEISVRTKEIRSTERFIKASTRLVDTAINFHATSRTG